MSQSFEPARKARRRLTPPSTQKAACAAFSVLGGGLEPPTPSSSGKCSTN